MADNFDKLIKEKVEEKHFDYSEKAWRSFKKSSGMSSVGAGAKIAIAISAAIITGGIAVFTYLSNRQPAETANKATQTVPEDSITIETPITDTITEQPVSQELTIQPEPQRCPAKSETAKSETIQENNIDYDTNATVPENTAPATNTKIAPVKKQPEQPSKWKINIIDIDTIR